jgi:LPS-assembly lipoprotein
MSLSDLARLMLLLAFTASASCGFRLQGVGDMPESLATTYIDTQDRYSVFYRNLVAELDRSGVDVVESPVHAGAVIRVSRDSFGQQVLTVSGRNVPTEYDVYYNIAFSVWINGEEALVEQALGLRQAYTYDPATVLGKNREEEAIRDALAVRLVRQVKRQLSLL